MLTVIVLVALAVAQVGSSAAEWSSVLKAVQHLAEPQQAASQAASSGPDSNTHAPSPADLRQAAAAAAVGSSSGGGGSSIGSASSSGGGCQVAAELLAELQHLPCFLLMEFVEGCKLSDTVAAVDPVSCVGETKRLLCTAHPRSAFLSHSTLLRRSQAVSSQAQATSP